MTAADDDDFVPFDREDPARKAARAKRLDAALTVLVDLNDPDSLAAVAHQCGGEVITLADLPVGQDGHYDPLAFSSRTNTQPADQTQTQTQTQD